MINWSNWRFMRLWLVLLAACSLAGGSCATAGIAQPFIPEDASRARKAYDYYQQALSAEQAGDLNSAVQLCRKSTSAYPRVKEVHHKLALLLAATGHNQEAKAEFRTALNIDYNYVECRNNYGEFLKSRDEVKDAMSQFKQCIQINPKYPYAYFNLGKMLHEKGDLQGAIENLESCTRLDPNFARGLEELGMCIYERASQGDLRDAEAALRRAQKLLPDNPLIRYHLAIIQLTACHLDEAETELREALIRDGRLAAAHFELGKLRYYRGDLDRCLAELAQAASISPVYTDEKKYPPVDPVQLKVLEAQSHEYLGDLVKAIETYQQIARLQKSDVAYAKHIQELEKQIKQEIKARRKNPPTYDPQEVDAYIAKGIDQYEDGNLNGARTSFERALALNPQSFRATQNIAFIQEAQGDLNGAMVSNQQSIQFNPKYDGAVYNLAYLLEKVGLPDDAGRMYQKFRGMAAKYPYDPRHIVELQQEQLRQQQKEEYIRKRGY
jgi:tetratricopeptide (TPR) repeat protein